MKILFLSHLVPWPTNTGGKQILYNLIKGLSVSHDVGMICFRHPDFSGDGGLSDFCRSVNILDIPRTRNVLLNAIVGLVRFVPLTISLYASRKHSATIREHLEKESYDVVISRIEMVQFIPASYKGPMILLMEDPEVLKFTRMDKRGWKLHQRIFRRFESSRLLSYERRESLRFDRVTLISEEDVADNRSLIPGARLVCVPYGTDTEWFSPPEESGRVDRVIVMTGNMYHPPNAAGAVYFSRDIFPLVKKQIPDVSFWIVGANPGPEVLRLGQTEGITVTGAVPDIRDYLRMARVSVCPVSLKIGVQTKVLEAMACGTPVVTTSAGNAGIRAESGDGLYIADSPSDFAIRIVSLLRGENWDEMSRCARQFVLDHFSWGKSVKKLEMLITEVIREHKK